MIQDCYGRDGAFISSRAKKIQTARFCIKIKMFLNLPRYFTHCLDEEKMRQIQNFFSRQKGVLLVLEFFLKLSHKSK